MRASRADAARLTTATEPPAAEPVLGDDPYAPAPELESDGEPWWLEPPPPEAPDLGLLRLLHRDTSKPSCVHFQLDLRGRGYDMEDGQPCWDDRMPPPARGGLLRVADLHDADAWIPEVRDAWLQALNLDAFASINTVHGTRRRWPDSDSFRRLNAAWVDCDCHQLHHLDAVARIAGAVAARVIPPPSVVVDSGCGAWTLWLLRDDDEPGMTPTAVNRSRELLIRINTTMGDRLRAYDAELRPDRGCTDVTRHLRVAGSVNSGSGTRVAYTVSFNSQAKVIRYTLTELRTFLNLADKLTTYGCTRSSGGKLHPKKRHGWIASHEAPLAEFQLLAAHRGGFAEGVRSLACLYLASLLRGAGRKPAEIYREVVQLASECRPPLRPEDAERQVRSALKRKKPRTSNAAMAARLGVTAGEVDALQLRVLRPDFRADQRRRTGLQRDNLERGHAFLLKLAEDHGSPLPFAYRQLVVMLNEVGITATLGTVKNWTDRLGLVVRGHRRRRAQVPLPLAVA